MILICQTHDVVVCVLVVCIIPKNVMALRPSCIKCMFQTLTKNDYRYSPHKKWQNIDLFWKVRLKWHTSILQRHLCKLLFNPIQSLKIRDLVIMRYRCYFGNQRECSYCDLFHCTEFLIPRGTPTPSSRLIQVIAKLDLWFLCHFKSATIPISVTHRSHTVTQNK